MDNDNNENELSLNDNKKSSIENIMFKELFKTIKTKDETINLLKESVKKMKYDTKDREKKL